MSWFQNVFTTGLGDIVNGIGLPIEIHRGNKKITGIKGFPGNGERRGVVQEVPRINGVQDWLVMASDYDFGDGKGPVVPERGDKIISNGTVYSALPQDGRDIYTGVIDCQHRVHTKVMAK